MIHGSAAFAVRVLTKIAEQQVYRRPVRDAFVSVDLEKLSEPVARDVSDAIARIGAVSPTSQADQWPGQRALLPLELRFHDQPGFSG